MLCELLFLLHFSNIRYYKYTKYQILRLGRLLPDIKMNLQTLNLILKEFPSKSLIFCLNKQQIYKMQLLRIQSISSSVKSVASKKLISDEERPFPRTERAKTEICSSALKQLFGNFSFNCRLADEWKTNFDAKHRPTTIATPNATSPTRRACFN